MNERDSDVLASFTNGGRAVKKCVLGNDGAMKTMFLIPLKGQRNNLQFFQTAVNC